MPAAVIVIGSGFAGLWAALGAARRRDELGLPADAADITVLAETPFHDIRVRNYEADLRGCRIPLSGLLDPVGVHHRTATVTGIDTAARCVTTAEGAVHRYDQLVLASGSRVLRPPVPGLARFGFDVDSHDRAVALQQHLRELARAARRSGRSADAAATTVAVIGAGLTGIETASELPGRLAALFGADAAPRVVLIDHSDRIGSDMGASARPIIEKALSDNGVETRTGVAVTAIEAAGVTLSSGETIAAGTVVWCAGMRASPLTAQLPVTRDRFGRLPVDEHLRVVGVPGVFAAGDVAAARIDDEHLSVMSCQHGRPMGRYAGYNVISELFDKPLIPLEIPWYVTVLDLGPAGAVYTGGWDRHVVATGAAAKATKVAINTVRIYPPLTGDAAALLASAAPRLEGRPGVGC